MARLVLKGGMEVATEIPIGALRTQAGLTLGIRAENVLAGAGVPARVDVIERLGDRTLVYALLGNGETIVFAEPGAAPVRVGDTVDLSFQESAIHLFGPDGMAIRAG